MIGSKNLKVFLRTIEGIAVGQIYKLSDYPKVSVKT